MKMNEKLLIWLCGASVGLHGMIALIEFIELRPSTALGGACMSLVAMAGWSTAFRWRNLAREAVGLGPLK